MAAFLACALAVAGRTPAPTARLEGDSAAARLAPMASVQRHLAGPAGFAPSDFDLLVNYRLPPPPAPAAVLALLRAPGLADSLLPALRRSLSPAPEARREGGSLAASAHDLIPSENLWPWLDVSAPGAAHGAASGPDDPEFLAHRARAGEFHLRAYAASLTRPERSYLRREAPGLFRHNADDTLLGPLERERERLKGEAVIDSVLGLAARLPLPLLAEAARDFDAVLRALLRAASGPGGATAAESLLTALRDEGLPVIIGSPGDDVHRLDALLAPRRRGIVFDPGGNDRYELAGLAQPGGWLIILDLSGDDVYHAGGPADTTADAAAFLGAQLIADLGGDDAYEGGDHAFGSALMGYARLYDASGNDRYVARSASLGFAFHGIGILHDRAGNDVYSSAFLSQGASSTFGFGILLDEAGDDAYVSRAEFLDDLRYRDRFLSLSQGFSTGFAPRYGGGVAVLWDRAGDDRYTADIFGQGAGYWFGWGLLMDDEGRDSLKAYQYAQGAGVHFAVGVLRDGGGDDARVSKGVSQGCGHDGGFGLFVDSAGDDRNTAVDMSAGAGSANGLGVMVDFGGDDVHDMGNPAMTRGHGDMRRDRASMGFFLDLGGRDAYPGGAKDSTSRSGSTGGAQTGGAGEGAVWRVYDGVKRGHGFGMDRE